MPSNKCDGGVWFISGDFVYLRSDQDEPFIARIDKIWTDTKYVAKNMSSTGPYLW